MLDASAALAGLLNDGAAREIMATDRLHVPHLVDPEVASGLRRQVASSGLTPNQGRATLDAWRRLGLTRHAVPGLLPRIWELRENLSSYDATYVALAEALSCSLVTADARISRAVGVRCPVTTVPR